MSSEAPAPVARRDVLRQSLGFAGLAPPCCSSPELPPASIRFDGGMLVVDLEVARQLRRAGSAAAVVDEARGLNLVVVCTGSRRYVALDRSCTHGGAMCAYQHERRTLRCTSLNHAEFALDGTLLHGRAHGNLRAYPARRLGSRLVIEVGPRS